MFLVAMIVAATIITFNKPSQEAQEEETFTNLSSLTEPFYYEILLNSYRNTQEYHTMTNGLADSELVSEEKAQIRD